MGLLEALRGQKEDEGATYYECRNCGTTAPQQSSECPVCESTEIAKYNL